ncbi:MAG: HNH endonuclease [Burkholderiales bacterium]
MNAESRSELYERFGINPKTCVYCGSQATDVDHFRAIVKAGKPSGYFHTTDNLVPCCGGCNQSKGGSDWKAWMNSAAKGSPATKRVSDLGAVDKFEPHAGYGEM